MSRRRVDRAYARELVESIAGALERMIADAPARTGNATIDRQLSTHRAIIRRFRACTRHLVEEMPAESSSRTRTL